jgi:hypothetical protein
MCLGVSKHAIYVPWVSIAFECDGRFEVFIAVNIDGVIDRVVRGYKHEPTRVVSWQSDVNAAECSLCVILCSKGDVLSCVLVFQSNIGDHHQNWAN